MAYTCPSCGFPALQEPPRSTSGGGSYEICPCCGFQFGVSDDDAGFTYASWRARWRARGLRWSSKGIASPPGWDAESQLASLRDSGPKSAAKKKSSHTRPRRGSEG
jgi:hypothetical protein